MASRPLPRIRLLRRSYFNFFRLHNLIKVARQAVTIGLMLVLIGNHALAAPQGMAAITGDMKYSAWYWWHTSGWAASFSKFSGKNQVSPKGWDGRGAPKRPAPEPEPQQTQAEREARVARIEVFPKETTVRPDEPVVFSAVGYDSQGQPIDGISFTWNGENASTQEPMTIPQGGAFTASKEGSYKVRVTAAGRSAEATATVSGTSMAPTGKPISTITVSSRNLPKPSQSSSMLPNTRQRFAKNASGSLATRYAPAGTKIVPPSLFLSIDGWNEGNAGTANAPESQRGNPPGHPPDEGVGSANFQFAAPLIGLDGRGINLNLGLNYNSRVWHKAGTQVTFDIDRSWPTADFSIGFTRVIGMGGQNGYMLVEPDGTRRPYTCTINFYQLSQDASCKTTDGSFIDYKVLGDAPNDGGAPRTTTVYYPNGTELIYVGATSNLNANYPVQIIDASGNRVCIAYRNNLGPQIDNITDTLGRVTQIFYDGNNMPVAVTAPGLDGTRRTIIRITYDWKNLANLGANYGFSGLTPVVRANSVPVIRAIYYPATSTGYWFGDADSYSAYGMLNKVIEQRGMSFSGAALPADPTQAADPGTITQGLMTRQMTYDYPMNASALTNTPRFANLSESWAAMTVAPAVTHYNVQENASPRRVEITRPDGVMNVSLSHNTPGATTDGMVYQTETYNPQGTLLGKSFVNWEPGDYSSPRPSRMEMTNERGQKMGREFSYGTRFNQVTEAREYGYGYVFGGTNTLLRKVVNQYLNDANYVDPQPANSGVWHHLFNLVTVNEIYAGDGTRMLRTEQYYDQFKGTAGLQNTPNVNYLGYEIGMSPYINSNYNIYNLDTRGNLTTIKRYANAATLDNATAVTEVMHYDITGNIVKIDSPCCEQTTINYNLDTQYAWPVSRTRGSASDATKQNTMSISYDFNTGLALSLTNANNRTFTTTYDSASLRPVYEYFPTGGYNYHIYDDTGLFVADFNYEAGQSGGNFAARTDRYLDGHGRVHGQISFGAGYVEDHQETEFDQLGRVSRQTRPYRYQVDAMQWTTFVYDSLDRLTQMTAPDGSITKRFYNESTYPSAATQGAPGETTRIVDGWNRQRWMRADPQGRMVEVVEPDPNGDGTLTSNGLLTKYTYDALDRLTLSEQGSQTRSFRYDGLNRLTHQKLAEHEATLNDSGQYVGSGTWSEVFSYDTRSNRVQSVDPRGVKTIVNYNNDPLNRRQSLQYDKSGVPAALVGNIPDAPTVTYAYLTTGDKSRLQSVTVAGGVGNTTYSYDSEGRLSREQLTFPGRESFPLLTDYVYDTLNGLTDLTYPQQWGMNTPRKTSHWTYDISSRMNSLSYDGTSFASNFVYNASSQVTSISIGSQITENDTYDPQTGLVTAQQVKQGTNLLLDLKYNYTLNNDANNSGAKTGQITAITDLKNQVRNQAFVYDTLGRLKQAKGGTNAFTSPTWTQSYAFDRYGNRTGVTKTGTAPTIPVDGLPTFTYNAASNRITTAGFAYDPAGNQTSAVVDANGNQQQYRYDAAGRLAQVLDGSGNVLATYTYGMNHGRMIGTEAGVTTFYGWSGGQVIAEYDAAGTSALAWRTSYIYMGGRLLATTNPGGTLFHHVDQRQTRLVTSTAGAVVAEQLTLPFGTMKPYGSLGGDNSYQSPTQSNPSKKRFAGYDRSDTTMLDYAVNRYYSSQQGRFTQVDPIGMNAVSLSSPQTLNLYAYCDGDPINSTDPSGLFLGKLFGWIGKAFKFLFKVAAVVLFVIAVVLMPPVAMAIGIATTTWGMALGTLALAGIAGLAGWHNGTIGQIAGAFFSAIGQGVNFRTPNTFPNGTGVGGVNGFLQNPAKTKTVDGRVTNPPTIDTRPVVVVKEASKTAAALRILSLAMRALSVLDLLLRLEITTGVGDTPQKITLYRHADGTNPKSFRVDPPTAQSPGPHISTFERPDPARRYNIEFQGVWSGVSKPGAEAWIDGGAMGTLKAVFSPDDGGTFGTDHWSLLKPDGWTDDQFMKGLQDYSLKFLGKKPVR